MLCLSTNMTWETRFELTGATTIPTNVWTKVTAERVGNTVRLKVNDAVDKSGTFSGTVYDSNAPLRVGATAYPGSERYFAGKIDQVRLERNVAGATAPAWLTIDYAYNSANQLTSSVSNVSQKVYAYDADGNNTQMVEKTLDGVNVLSQVAMGYDALNRMVSYSGPKGTESFSYRGAEWHRSSANGTSFLYDGDNVVADISGGNIAATYVTPFLDQNLSMTIPAGSANAGTYYYSQDGLGSVRTLTNASGAAVNKYDYAAFGETYAPGTSVTVQQRYTYTGRELNPVSDLMYYRYRTYDSAVGRFGGRDPIGYGGGIGLYTYVGNRPNAFTDPTGEVPQAAVAIAAAALVCLGPHMMAGLEYYPHDEKMRHCWTSCMAARTCGTILSAAAGLGFEVLRRP